MRKDISTWEMAHTEERGVNKKEWVTDPETGEEALFKETQIKDNQESTFADYGESIVSDLCGLLGVPCARVELVERNGKKGCISYSFINPNEYEELIEMGTVIQNTRLKFDSKSMYDSERKEAYGISMILEGLESVATSKRNLADLRRAFLIDVLTDSLIDHYDRNPANLSIIRNLDNVRLSPKYDNGTSLSISVPEDVLRGFMEESDSLESLQSKVRSNVLSKIGYLGRKFVKYPDLETYIFNYHYDDVKDFVKTIEERLTDENIDALLTQEKYAELDPVHREIIRGKLITNRDAMLDRFRVISKKQIIDKVVYNRAASNNFKTHVKKGTIQSVVPEYESTIGVQDEDPDYDLTLDEQIPEKMQALVDIEQLARYFQVPLDDLTKREKSLLKWTTLMENIRKANNDPNTYATITSRLGFLEEDKALIDAVIKDKFKDENDILEAREIIYGPEGIGEENVNLYLAKKFVDAATMRKGVREQRMHELRVFSRCMKEAVELENIVEKLPVKTRTLQKVGISDKRQLKAIQYDVARAYRDNPRMTKTQILHLANEIAISEVKDFKEEIQPGIFVAKKDAEDVRAHTTELPDGTKLVLFDRNTKLRDTAFKMGVDYFGQVSEHHSGDGITLFLTTRKGIRFPERVSSFAKDIIKKYSKPIYPDKSFVFREPEGDRKSESCFVVTSVNGSDARIPKITPREAVDKLKSLFMERERDDKSFLDD